MTINQRLIFLFFAIAFPVVCLGLEHKSYELNGLPLKLGIFSKLEAEGGAIDLAPKLKEMGIDLEGYEKCFYAAHARQVVIVADRENISLFEKLIEGLYGAKSLRETTLTILEQLETLPEDKRLVFIEKQGFFPDQFVDALARESLFAQENAVESEAIRARQKLKDSLANAIPYLRKQMDLIERESEPDKEE